MSLELYEVREMQRIASVLVGLPYKFGAEVDGHVLPERARAMNMAFDCSELVEYVYFRLGYFVPDGSINQWKNSSMGSIPTYGALAFKRRVGESPGICHVALVVDILETVLLEATPPVVRLVSFATFTQKSRGSKTEFCGIGKPALKRIV